MSPLHLFFMQICYGLLSHLISTVRRDQFQESYEQQWRMDVWLWKHPASRNFFSGESAMSIYSLNSPFSLIRTFSRVAKCFIDSCLCNRNKIQWGNGASIFFTLSLCFWISIKNTYVFWLTCLGLFSLFDPKAFIYNFEEIVKQNLLFL